MDAIHTLLTETNNPATAGISGCSTLEMLRLRYVSKFTDSAARWTPCPPQYSAFIRTHSTITRIPSSHSRGNPPLPCPTHG